MANIKKALLDFLTHLDGVDAIPDSEKQELDKAISLLTRTDPKKFTLRGEDQEKLEACIFINKIFDETIPELQNYPANEQLLINFLKQTDLYDRFQKNKKFVFSSENPIHRPPSSRTKT